MFNITKKDGMTIKKFSEFLKECKKEAEEKYEDDTLDLLSSYAALLDITIDFFENHIIDLEDI